MLDYFLACGDGTETIMKNTKKQNIPVYPANNTMFIGEVERVGKFEEACKACGECELEWTRYMPSNYVC